MNGWQPIATVPKDGTSVLLWCSHGQYVASWEQEDKYTIEYWHVSNYKEEIPLRGSGPSYWKPLDQPVVSA